MSKTQKAKEAELARRAAQAEIGKDKRGGYHIESQHTHRDGHIQSLKDTIKFLRGK